MSGGRRLTPPWPALWSSLGAQLGPILALLAFAGGALGFGLIASEVAEGETAAFDRALMLALRNPANLADPLGPPWLEEAARDLTGLGGFTVLTLVTVAVAGFLSLSGKRRAALFVLLAVVGGTALGHALKFGFERARPDIVPHVVRVYTASFPSAHAMMSAVVYLTLGALVAGVQPGRRLKAYLLGIAVALTLLVGASRVYLGVHWPTDVLAGWCLGAAWAIGCWLVERLLQRRGQVEGEAPGTPRPRLEPAEAAPAPPGSR